jgi:hypothetical protein
MALARSQVDPHHDAVVLHQQMHFGAIATPGVTQRMVWWLKDLHAFATVESGQSRRLVACAAGGPTRSNNGGIDAPQAMAEATVAFELVQEMGEQFGPGAIRPPAIEAVVDGLPRTKAFGDVPPRSPGMQDRP